MPDRPDHDGRTDGRASDGRFARGNPGGPGRPALPDWYKAAGPDVLRLQLRAVQTGTLPLTTVDPETGETKETEQIVDAKTRAAVAAEVSDRIYGKAAQSVEHSAEVGEALLELLKR